MAFLREFEPFSGITRTPRHALVPRSEREIEGAWTVKGLVARGKVGRDEKSHSRVQKISLFFISKRKARESKILYIQWIWSNVWSIEEKNSRNEVERQKKKKIWIIRHGTLEFGSDLIFPMIRPDKQMSTRKEQHVYATVPRDVDSHKLPCWLSIIKNTWSCRSPALISPFRSTNTPVRVFPTNSIWGYYRWF